MCMNDRLSDQGARDCPFREKGVVVGQVRSAIISDDDLAIALSWSFAAPVHQEWRRVSRPTEQPCVEKSNEQDKQPRRRVRDNVVTHENDNATVSNTATSQELYQRARVWVRVSVDISIRGESC
jgi:hypothetical protein